MSKRRKLYVSLFSLSISVSALLFLNKGSQAGVYVLPPDYENIYRSSLSDISSGEISYGSPLVMRDYNGNIISSGMQWMGGVPCYVVPKISCQNGRTASITTSITTVYSQERSTGRLYKLNGFSVRPLDLGNTWAVCVVSNTSTTEDFFRFNISPCYNNGGVCFTYSYEYSPERNSRSFTPGNPANITLQAQYKQYCR